MKNIIYEVRMMYKAAIDAVKPGVLVNRAVRCLDNVVTIKEDVEVEVNGNCHVVGFGKAVLGMALQLDNILGHHIKKGIISIPHGVQSQYTIPAHFSSKYQLFEGAVNNIPDEHSVLATQQIENLVLSLKDGDILFVLISGGGSALLSSPVNGLSLEDKQKIIQTLSKSGANIQELNSVRKRLSRIKGGKLAQLSFPHTTITLILSDVIGSPLEVIASGPTVENNDTTETCRSILHKYQLEEQLPAKVVQLLCQTPSNELQEMSFSHVNNILIGSNLMALQAAETYAMQLGFSTAILSDHIEGEAKLAGQHFAQLAHIVAQMMIESYEEHKYMESLSVVAESLCIPPSFCCKLERLIRGCRSSRKDLCLIGGGETTVAVRGSGKGGRNQEMVLSFLIEMGGNVGANQLDIAFLSAGTDGIDGPTDAGGALCLSGNCSEAVQQGLDPQTFLENNDAYNFFRQFREGANHLIVGPTGTNVMDIQLLCFKWK